MSDDALLATHEAIVQMKQGQLAPPEAIRRLVEGRLLIPLGEPPNIVDGQVQGWSPKIFSPREGVRMMVAFTSNDLLSAFMGDTGDGFLEDGSPASFLAVDTLWVLQRLPDGIGLMINGGTDAQLAWNAAGIAKYKQDHLAAG